MRVLQNHPQDAQGYVIPQWRQRGVGFATITHAAGISSTGDPALDLRLPFDEPYRIPEQTAAAIIRAKSNRRRVVAIGTTVARALEAAASSDGGVRAGDGVASERIGRDTPLRVVDTILTGVHQPGESHFELLRAFATDAVLNEISVAVSEHGYRPHEFGDSILVAYIDAEFGRVGTTPASVKIRGNGLRPRVAG